MEKRKKDLGLQQPWGAVPRRRASDWLMFKMRLPVVIASVVCSLTCVETSYGAPTTSPPPAAAAKKANSARKMGLTIRVEGNGWGTASKESIETVLYSVADELMWRLPKKLSAPIVVTHTESNPIALYERGSHGEYLIHLHATDQDWQFYVYEFAHELCHILSNYDENFGPESTSRYNQWFEETLCETASLYTLKNLAKTWETSPPAPKWTAEAGKLRRFYDLLINEGHRRLPAHSPLASWLRENEEPLRHNPYLRDKNEVVANLLLPLFESNPENWDALGYLNLNPADARANFQQYLKNWYENAPGDHKLFITRVLALLRGDSGAPPATGEKPMIAAGGGTPSIMVSSSGNGKAPETTKP